MGFEGGYLRMLFTTGGGGSGALSGYCGLKRWFFKVISVYMVVESLSDGAVDFSYILRNSGISVSDLSEARSEGSKIYELNEVPVKWISGRFYLFMCVSCWSISDCDDFIWLSASRPFFTFRA